MILEEIASLEGYELLDSGAEARLERFGDFVLSRPDPGALWQRSLDETVWHQADATFTRSVEDRGNWVIRKDIVRDDIKHADGKSDVADGIATQWVMRYKDISFYARLTPFKHTGVFPEQAANWEFIERQLSVPSVGSSANAPRVLNLFGYTGIPSVLAAKRGAQVTHVDASKPSIGWAQENMKLSSLADDAIRWILDDALKFVKREVRRGAKYEAIIMDPPAFGRGAKGEVWKFHEQFPELLHEAARLIDPDTFRFVIINAYAVSLPSLLLQNMLEDFSAEAGLEVGLAEKKSDEQVNVVERANVIEHGELVLAQKNGRKLSTGIFGRMYRR